MIKSSRSVHIEFIKSTSKLRIIVSLGVAKTQLVLLLLFLAVTINIFYLLAEADTSRTHGIKIYVLFDNDDRETIL